MTCVVTQWKIANIIRLRKLMYVMWKFLAKGKLVGMWVTILNPCHFLARYCTRAYESMSWTIIEHATIDGRPFWSDMHWMMATHCPPTLAVDCLNALYYLLWRYIPSSSCDHVKFVNKLFVATSCWDLFGLVNWFIPFLKLKGWAYILTTQHWFYP